MNITVTKRLNDYHAEAENGMWGCGKTPMEAIGSLVNTHPEYFNIIIKRDFIKEE
jgi:hypothetical protein